MRWTTIVVMLAALAGCGDRSTTETAAAGAPPAAGVPAFEVDPTWLKLEDWVLGQVSDVYVDQQDRVWVLHRPRTVPADQLDRAAPAVLQLDLNGRVVGSWGGPGEGYDWPTVEHGLFVDHEGFVWIAGNGEKDNQVLKFTSDGTFVMQIGRSGQSTGNADTQNVNRAADVFVHARTNEVFVGDGYGNRRISVWDADTGAFERMWGAFGNVPADPQPGEALFFGDDAEGQGPPQFNNPHCVHVSNDDLVYVCDRDNQRVQVFTLDGKFLSQVFISHGRMPQSTAAGTAFGKPRNEVADQLLRDPAAPSRMAFSPDPEQRFMYVIDRRQHLIQILDRRSLEIVGTVGDGPGEEPGQFYILHSVATDSSGNIYTAEVTPGIESQGGLPGRADAEDPNRGNRRVQKFALTVDAPAAPSP